MSAWRDYRLLVGRNPVALASLAVAVLSTACLALAGLGWLRTSSLSAGLRDGVGVLGAGIDSGVGQLVRFTWPAVALLVAALALFSPQLTHGTAWLARRTSKVKLGEVELEFSPEAAKQLAQTTEEAFSSFRERADREFRRQVVALDIRSLLEATLNAAAARLPNGSTIPALPTARCTLYVKDLLFEDRLYQLTEYYPWDGRPNAGRTFSTRFGIVGRAWRTESHMGAGHVQADLASLIRDWGMLREEASRLTRQRPSYLCAILRAPAEDGSHVADGRPVGLFFADADERDAFGPDAEALALAAAVAEAALHSGLRTKLKVLRDEITRYSAAIRP